MNTNLSQISPPLKVLFTSYLIITGIGFIAAFNQILMTNGMADGKSGLSVFDVIYSYYGNRTGTRIEQKLNGSMKVNASLQDRSKIIAWLRNGADETRFRSQGIDLIFQKNCISCHSANTSIPDYTVFSNIKQKAVYNQGASIKSLTRISHIHLFGISFIFFFVCFIFSFSQRFSTRTKCFLIAIPFASQLMNIVSWWFTKWMPEFAITILLGGLGMSIAFTVMWLVSMHEMWFLLPKNEEDSTP